jgi:hypothetical protein
MSVQAILAPVFVLVALAFIILLWSGYVRFAAVRRGEAGALDVAANPQGWPPRVIQAGNSFNNQFQLPVLFYVLVILALFLHKADFLFVVMSWLFVISRIFHAGIHVSTNNIGWRFPVYTVGLIILLLMWVIFAVRILLNIS